MAGIRACPGHGADADEGVSDVLGAILLVGLTVGMTVVLGILLLTFEGPTATPHARLAIEVQPGGGGWGSGDESIVVRHLGGDALDDSTRIAVRVGASVLELTGPALGGGFADGTLAIGESWTLVHPAPIPSGTLVAVDVVGTTGSATMLLASASIVAMPEAAP